MSRRNLAPWLAGCLLAAVAVPAARGQMQESFCEPLCTHDMQLFAPVDFDFNCLPIQDDCGWFFNYNRLNWAMTGERAEIGSPGRTVTAERILRENAFDDLPDQIPEGVLPTPYTVINGIQDGGPDANFGWGNRYEIGFTKGGNGWLVGVLDGPTSVTEKWYGFQHLQLPNSLPLLNPVDVGGPGFGNPNFNAPDFAVVGAVRNGTADIPTTLHGFGSVHVNFEVPNGYLFGWRDYHVNGPNNTQNPTVGGPSYVVTTIVRANGLVTTIAVVRGADGIIDNLDGDLIAGFGVILADIDGDGTIDDDEIIATFADLDDLHEFNIRFDVFGIRNVTRTDGVELMRTHELDNSHMPVKEQRNRFAIGYGARFLRLDDNFYWEGRGDVFGRTFTGTDVENQIVGPQIRAKWTHQRGRVGFDLDGRFLAGYNIQDLQQTGGIGEDLNPGGLNDPLFAQPTYFSYGRQENFFSPVAEMRVEGSYQLTTAFAAKLGYTAMYIDNISRASSIVRYRLPDMGFVDNNIGKQGIFVNGLDFGIEAVY